MSSSPHHHCLADILAEFKKILETVVPPDVNIMDQNELQTLLEKIIVTIKGAEEPEVPEPGKNDGDEDLATTISSFGSKHASKPFPWNCEDEEAVKRRTEKFNMYKSNAGDKVCRNIFKKIPSLSDDTDLEDEKKGRRRIPSSNPSASNP